MGVVSGLYCPLNFLEECSTRDVRTLRLNKLFSRPLMVRAEAEVEEQVGSSSQRSGRKDQGVEVVW